MHTFVTYYTIEYTLLTIVGDNYRGGGGISLCERHNRFVATVVFARLRLSRAVRLLWFTPEIEEVDHDHVTCSSYRTAM